MLRREVVERFALDSAGFILTPGPFYQERLYIPHFYQVVQKRKKQHKERSRDGALWDVCTVSSEDRKQYPELVNIETVGVREESGVVLSWIRAWHYHNNS